MSQEIKNKLVLVAACAVALLLQLIVAPYVTIGYAMPNFILCTVVILSLLYPEDPSYVCAFIFGMLYDLASSGPVGAMALICVAITWAISTLHLYFDDDSLFMPIILIIISCFAGEAAYAVLMIACGYDVSFLDALVYRILPCGIYDTVISLIAFIVWLRIKESRARKSDMSFFS